MKKLLLLLLCMPLIFSCGENYEKEKNQEEIKRPKSFLELWKVKGNVKSAEYTMYSVSEKFGEIKKEDIIEDPFFDSDEWFFGNKKSILNKFGDIKKISVYNNEGNKIAGRVVGFNSDEIPISIKWEDNLNHQKGRGEFKLDSFQLYARKAFKNLSNNPVNFAMMSNVLKSENKIDSLLYHFERISSRVDDFQLHRIMLASLVDSEEYKDKGIQIVNNAIELYPDIEEFKVLSNYIEYSKNNIKLSEEVQRNAIELYKQGSFKMAITLFEESIRLFPKSKSYHFNLLTAYNDNNLYTRLIDHYEGILIDDFKIDKELQLLYINALFNSSKFDLACNMIKKIDPINSLEISKKIMSKCN